MNNKRFTLILDSSQISTYMECPQKWYNQYVLRLVPANFDADKSAEAMNAGTYGHKLLDIAYKLKARGQHNFNTLLETAYAYDPDKSTCECGCDLSTHHTLQGLGIDECTRCRKCLQFRPHPFALSQDVRFKVRARFQDYLLKYRSQDIQPISEEHVEVGFSEAIYEDDSNLFVLEGRIDLLGTLQGLPIVCDHKVQLSTHWLYPHSIQFKNYALVSKIPTFVINYIRLGKEVKDDTMYRELVNFSISNLLAWKSKLINIYHNIKTSLVSRTFDHRWNSCSGSYKTYDKVQNHFCWYGSLCEEGDEKVRERKEHLLYKIQPNVWRPW